jgi:GAF domain-containing protein
VNTLHNVLSDKPSVKGSRSQERSLDSRSDTYLRAARLVSDLHQRAALDIPALLREVIECAAEVVPGAQYAGATVTRRRHPAGTEAATHRYPVLLDEIQNHCQQGPGLAAGALQESIRIDDLPDDDRWPLYRDEALRQTPVRSILSIPMFKEGGTTATLNFYSEIANAFDVESVDLGLIFATHTGLVWNMMRRDQQFHSALASRDVIGQAKGRMMERFNIDAAQAFEMLKLMSQDSNTPIAQVAQHVVAGQVWASPE